jgi:ATP-dependent Clp protease ATP-binding subunit ClpA
MAQARRLTGFDDFDERSRRVLFHARSAISEFGGAALTPDHLLLGALSGAPDAVGRLLHSSDSIDVLKQDVLATLGTDVRPLKSAEIPISAEAEHVLVTALDKARTTTSKTLRPEHILLALLESSHTKAVEVLRRHGITEETVAAYLKPE